VREEFVGAEDVGRAESDVTVGGGDVKVNVGVEVIVGLIVNVGIGVSVESDG